MPENGDMEQSRATFERLLRERYPDAIVRSQHQLAAVGPAAETVWYATNRHYRSRLSATVEVGAEQPLVFDIYTRRFPDWQVAVSVRRAGDGDGLVGTTYVATYRVLGRQFKGRFTIIDA
ncbi:MAG TPA: hypothetical protein VNW68_03700, partial [Candidatus Limnocylindria bacterium]|nr:hypothetical protein [Candidatus Limnocylindria bacterium]